MKQYQYTLQNLLKYKSTNIAVVVQHQQYQPYVGEYNYFKNLTLPIFRRYCKDNDIDLILITDFKKDTYSTSQPQIFGKRITMYPFECLQQIIQHYDYISSFCSHALLHKNFPSLYDVIDYNYDAILANKCFNPINKQQYQDPLYTLKYSMAQSGYDKNTVLKYYINRPQLTFWSGKNIILNKNVKQWIDPDLIYSVGSNHMLSLLVQYATNQDKQYKVKFDNEFNMFNMHMFLNNLISNCYDRSLVSYYKKFIQNIHLYEKALKSNSAVLSFFTGCGSSSAIWKLRYLMMEYSLQNLSQYYY